MGAWFCRPIMRSNRPVVSRSREASIWGFAFPLAQWIQTALLPLDAPLSNFTSKVPVLYVLFSFIRPLYHMSRRFASSCDIRSYQSISVIPMPLGYIDFPLSVGTILAPWFLRRQDPSPEGDRLFGQESAACRCQWESRSLLHHAAGRSGFFFLDFGMRTIGILTQEKHLVY